MTCLREQLERYLAIRRAPGFKLVNEGRMLNDFVAFADAAGEGTITIQTALSWAKLPTGGCHAYLSQRMPAIRGFARYLHGVDPSVEVPPLDLLPARKDRPTPYIYSDRDIVADASGPSAATAFASGDVRDADRSARLHWDTDRGSVPPRPRGP